MRRPWSPAFSAPVGLRAAGDVLLVSAHLAPVRQEGEEELAGRDGASVFPQYDNPGNAGLADRRAGKLELARIEVDPPEMTIGQMEGIPAFLSRAQARWRIK